MREVRAKMRTLAKPLRVSINHITSLESEFYTKEQLEPKSRRLT